MKVLSFLILLLASPLSAMEIAVHFTDAAQQKIDAGVDQFWAGTININAFHVRFDLIENESHEEGVYCLFNCAHPYQDKHSNAEFFLKPKFESNSLHITIPEKMAKNHVIRMTCESKTLQLIHTKMPPSKICDTSQQKHELTIDYTDKLGFFILENM